MWRLPVSKEYVVHTMLDPAVDSEESSHSEYLRTLDPKHLVIKDGGKLAKFVVRPLTTREALACDLGLVDPDSLTMEDIYKKAELALRYALLRIESDEVIDVERGSDGLVTLEFIDSLQSHGLVMELASYVRQLSHLPLVVGHQELGSTAEN